MRKQLLKFASALFVTSLLTTVGFSQTLTVDNFDYATGTLLRDQAWMAHSGAGTNSIAVVNSNLTYATYPSVGKAVAMVKSGEDVTLAFEGQTTGVVYASFLANISDAGTAVAGDYFFHFITAGSTTFRGRVFVKKHETEPKLAFGITRAAAGSAAVWTDFVYDLNTTHLIVLKYEFVDGDANDICSLIINPTIGSAEPVATVVNAVETGSDFAVTSPLNAVALRQGSATTGSILILDGVRVATTWDALFTQNNEAEIVALDFLDAVVWNTVISPVVNNAATISVEVAFGTNITSITPTMTISGGASINPAAGDQPLDFTTPKVYSVTSEDGLTTNNYTISVTVGQEVIINQFPYVQTFEAANATQGWNVFDIDGGNAIWNLSNVQNHTEGGLLSVRHTYSGSSAGLQDGWLVTPKIQIPSTGEYELSLWSYNEYPGDYGQNSVEITTGSSIPSDSAYVTVWTPTTVTAEWSEQIIDLAPYAGQTIQIAFVYKGTNAHAWSVDDISISEKATTYAVTFDVTAGTTDIAGASIAINGQTLTTDASGVATIELANGTYPYTVSATGYNSANAEVVVNGAAVNVPVSLTETIETPFGLLVEVTDNDAAFSWNNDLSEVDDMESYTDFAIENIGEYTMVDVDGSATYGITNTTFENSGYTGSYIVFNPSATTPALATAQWTAFSGSKYLACFAATTPSNNDWLITPQVTGVAGMQFSFMAKSVTDQYGLERFNVAVSTTGTEPANFTVISGSTYVQAPTAWTAYSYDLSAYAGQNIYVAIQCVSNDAFAFMVDDIAFGVSKENSKDFVGYTVYLDGAQVAEGLTTTSYNFVDVAAGNHEAGVKAVYTSGSSEIVSAPFVIEASEYTVTFNVTSSNVAVSGATININGQQLTTNAAGIATIVLTDATYPFSITKDGYDEYVSEVVVNGADVNVPVSLTVGINDVATSNVSIYPNPAADVIFIERTSTENVMVEMYNNKGIVVSSFEMNEARQEVNISDLNSGVYFIRIVGETTTNVVRFIKK